MRPYSIGHELWLIRQGNPLAWGGDADIKQLREAALICCETWEGLKRLNSEWSIGLKLALWNWRQRNALFPIELANFTHYRERGSLCFEINSASPGRTVSRRPGAPFLLRLQMFLVEHSRLTESDAWDYPLGLAMMKRAAWLESEDCLEIKNEDDETTQGFAEANDARLKVMIDSGMTPESAWAKLLEEGLSCQV